MAIVCELDRTLSTIRREKHGADYAGFTELSAKFSGMRAAIKMLQQRRAGGEKMKPPAGWWRTGDNAWCV